MSNEIQDPDLKLRYISNSFIASVPRYVVLKRLMSPKKLAKIDIHGRANKQTGPYYVRTGVKKKKEVTLIPIKKIYPYLRVMVLVLKLQEK